MCALHQSRKLFQSAAYAMRVLVAMAFAMYCCARRPSSSKVGMVSNPAPRRGVVWVDRCGGAFGLTSEKPGLSEVESESGVLTSWLGSMSCSGIVDEVICLPRDPRLGQR